jgi:DNA helicase-2/ATP-dependent DNA helicase PcrA
MLDDTGYGSSFRQDLEEDMDRMANVLELRSDIARYNDLPPESALPTYLEQVSLVADVDSLDRNPGAAVTLITLHSAKGLEFPVVFISGVEEGLLPISRAIEAEYEHPDQIEEERRLFYVGITRAKQLLYITYTGMRMSYGRIGASVPSRFIEALPEEHIRVLSARTGRMPLSSIALADRVRSATRASSYGGSALAAPRFVPTYETGQRVFHTLFGEGTVIEVVARNNDQELAIEFQRHGKKRLLASLAPLDLVSD